MPKHWSQACRWLTWRHQPAASERRSVCSKEATHAPAARPAEREREASNLIRSNGGRWKHSEEMVRALKVWVCGEFDSWTMACCKGELK